MFHSCLAVKLLNNQPHVIGLTGQKAWTREERTENSSPKMQKESQVWKEMIDQIGPAPLQCKWTTVGDRGADIFSFIKSLPTGWDCVQVSRSSYQLPAVDA